MGNAQAELPLSKLSFLEKQMPPQKPGEFGYDVVSSSKLYQRLLSDLEAGRKNSVISYLEKKGYARGELREIFGKVREGGAASEFACIALIYGLGAYLGVEKIVSDAKLAESRGDQMKNFFLYTDERTVKGVNGAFLQNLLLNALRESKIEPGLKVTKEAYDEFSLDKGHVLNQISFYIDVIGNSELLEKDKPGYVSQLEYLKGRIGGMGPKDWEDMEGAFGQAEKVYSQFTYARYKMRVETGPEPVEAPVEEREQVRVATPLDMLLGFSRGKGNDAQALKDALVEAGAIDGNWGLTTKGNQLIDRRKPQMILEDLKRGYISGAGEQFLSRLAVSLVLADSETRDMLKPVAGAETERFGLAGKLETGLERRLDKMLRAERLFTEGKVGGKKGVEALAEIIAGGAAKPAEKEVEEKAIEPVREIETKPRELKPQTERRELPVQQLGGIAPGEKEEEQSPAENAREYIRTLTGGEAAIYRLEKSTISNFAKNNLLERFAGWIEQELRKLPEDEQEKRLAILPQVLSAYIATVERRETVDLLPGGIEKEFKSRLGE